MTSVGSTSAASAGQAQDPQVAGWENQNLEGANNSWKTESTDVKNNSVQAPQALDDSKARTAIQNVMGQMMIEMFKQQNPTDKSKFSMDNDE